MKNNINFYKLALNSVTKIAAVEDVFRGMQGHDAIGFLQYNENNIPEDVLKSLQDYGYGNFTDSVANVLLFLKFPRVYHFKLYSLVSAIRVGAFDSEKYASLLKKYIGRTAKDPETEIMIVWELMKNTKKFSFSENEDIPALLPDAIYQDLLAHYNFKEKVVFGILENYYSRSKQFSEYPKFFIEELKKRFPEASFLFEEPSDEQKKQIITDSIGVPHASNMARIEKCMNVGWQFRNDSLSELSQEQIAINNKIRKFNESLLPFLLEHSGFEKRMCDIILRKHNKKYNETYDEIESTSFAQMVEMLLVQSEQSNEVYADNEYFALEYFKDTKSSNEIQPEFFVLDKYFVKKYVLQKMLAFAKRNPEGTIKLSDDGSDLSQLIEDDATLLSQEQIAELRQSKNILWGKCRTYISDDETKTSVEIFGTEYVDYVPFNSRKTEDADGYGYSKKSSACMMSANKATLPSKANFFRQWFYKNIGDLERSGDAKKLQYFFADLVGDDIFNYILEHANNFCGAVYVSGNNVIKEEEFDPNKNYGWSSSVDSMFKLALEIMAQIPDKYIRKIVNMDNYYYRSNTWLAICSGAFPCDVVYEIVKKHPSEAIKVTNSIKCKGQNSEKIIEQIREELVEKTQAAKKNIMSGIKEFLATDGAIEKNISDFPDLFEFAKEQLAKRTPDEEYLSRYNKSTRYDRDLLELQNLKIYIIDYNKFSNYFGSENLINSGFGFGGMGGFYSPQYNLTDYDTIVIFTNNKGSSKDTVDIIHQNMDFQVSENLTASEENILWHEVAHYLAEIKVPHEGDYQTAAGWAKDPNEMIAISNGNIPHIERKLRTLLNNIYPFDGRLTSGIIEQIKSDIIESMPDEFHGLPRMKAEEQIEKIIGKDGGKLIGLNGQISREEIINTLVEMFTDFFSGNYLREKFEQRIYMDTGKKVIEFEQESIPKEPEQTSNYMRNRKDDIITEYENRSDFQKFKSDVYKRVNQIRDKQKIARYVDRVTKQPKMIFEIEDLLMYMFDGPSTINLVNLETTNSIFADLIPQTLLNDVVDLVKKEREVRAPVQTQNNVSQITPQEAQDAGEFISKTKRELGDDWYQVANTKMKYTTSNGKINFYKLAVNSQIGNNNLVEIPQSYIPTILKIVKKCDAIGLIPYAVGGFVRDLYMGKKPKDLDIMVYPPSETEDYQRYEIYTEKLAEQAKDIVKDEKSAIEFLQPLFGNSKVIQKVEDCHFVPGRTMPGRQSAKEFYYIKAKVTYIDNNIKARNIDAINKGKKTDQDFAFSVDYETSINPSYLFASEFGSRIPRGEAFGIYAVNSGDAGIGEIEVAYPRSEQYSQENGRKPRTEIGGLEEDSKRRDFKMNAMRIDLRQILDGSKVAIDDPTGGGIRDINDKNISVSDDDAIGTIFSDDPLRVLRAFRQSAQHGFTIDPKVIEFIKQHSYYLTISNDRNKNTPLDSDGFLPKLSAERVGEEMKKIMSLPNAPETLNSMKEAGILNYVLGIPQENFDRLDLDQRNKHHNETIWEHTMSVMRNINTLLDDPKFNERFGDKRMVFNLIALCHDLGKTSKYEEKTDKKTGNTYLTYTGHAMDSEMFAKGIMKRLRFPEEDVNYISKMAYLHDDVLNLEVQDPDGKLETMLDEKFLPTLIKKVEQMSNSGGDRKKIEESRQQIYDLLLFGMADRMAHVNPDPSVLQQAYDKLQQGMFDDIQGTLDPWLDSNFIVQCGIRPGPAIKVINEALMQAQMGGIIKNQEQARILIKAICDQILNQGIDQKDVVRINAIATNFLGVYKQKGFDEEVLSGGEILNAAKLVAMDVKPGKWIKEMQNEIKAQNITDKQMAIDFVKEKAKSLFLQNQQNASNVCYWYKISAKEKRPSRIRRKKTFVVVEPESQSSSSVMILGEPKGAELSENCYREQTADYANLMAVKLAQQQQEQNNFVGNPLNNDSNIPVVPGSNAEKQIKEIKKVKEKYPGFDIIIPFHSPGKREHREDRLLCEIVKSKKTEKYYVKYPDQKEVDTSEPFDNVLEARNAILDKGKDVKLKRYIDIFNLPGYTGNDINDNMPQFNG